MISPSTYRARKTVVQVHQNKPRPRTQPPDAVAASVIGSMDEGKGHGPGFLKVGGGRKAGGVDQSRSWTGPMWTRPSSIASCRVPHLVKVRADLGRKRLKVGWTLVEGRGRKRLGWACFCFAASVPPTVVPCSAPANTPTSCTRHPTTTPSFHRHARSQVLSPPSRASPTPHLSPHLDPVHRPAHLLASWWASVYRTSAPSAGPWFDQYGDGWA